MSLSRRALVNASCEPTVIRMPGASRQGGASCISPSVCQLPAASGGSATAHSAGHVGTRRLRRIRITYCKAFFVPTCQRSSGRPHKTRHQPLRERLWHHDSGSQQRAEWAALSDTSGHLAPALSHASMSAEQAKLLAIEPPYKASKAYC